MNYVTAFDFTTAPPFGWVVWVIIGVVALVAVTLPLRLRETGKLKVAFGALALVLVVSAASMAMPAMRYMEVREAVERGNFRVAEGEVSNFAPAKSQAAERFDLNGEHFAYQDGLTSTGYNVTKLWGGRIRDGARVRIAYYDASWNERVITKLEIAQEDYHP